MVGASYGGFMALASSVAYAPRLVAAIDSAGISHFVTLLEGTETYRRDLARAEYGDEREPDMRRYLDAISPLSHAEKIRVPLLVSHGRNDPRVPVTEAEQIVRRCVAMAHPSGTCWPRTKGNGFAKVECGLPVRCANAVSRSLPAAAELTRLAETAFTETRNCVGQKR